MQAVETSLRWRAERARGTEIRCSRASERSERLAPAFIPGERKRAVQRCSDQGERPIHAARPTTTTTRHQRRIMRTRRIESPEPPLYMEWISELKRERREQRLFLSSTHQLG